MRRLLPFVVLFAVLGCSEKPRTELKNPTGPPPVNPDKPSEATLPNPDKEKKPGN